MRPVRRLWQCTTAWKVELAWWLGELEPDAVPVPNPAEVDSIHWFTPAEMAVMPELLESNREFLELVERGEIRLEAWPQTANVNTRMSPEYIIYTDESEKKGRFYSNFYGGVLVRSPDLHPVIVRLEACKTRLNLHGEVKWQKVTENYREKYATLMGAFFDEVEAGRVKVRVMFTQNQYIPTDLSSEQRRAAYHLLYYQFIKHAFGLRFAGGGSQPIMVRLNMDQLPDNREQNAQFKAYLLGLNRNSAFRVSRIRFRADQIAEVRSHDHVLLQCLDVVLGAMAFRLNDKHKEKPPGQARRGSRTIAKEKLYRLIRTRICSLYPNFNIGETTGKAGNWANLWLHSYRHWKFVPAEHEGIEPHEVQKITPRSLCLAASPKWNLGLREQQGLLDYRPSPGKCQSGSWAVWPEVLVWSQLAATDVFAEASYFAPFSPSSNSRAAVAIRP